MIALLATSGCADLAPIPVAAGPPPVEPVAARAVPGSPLPDDDLVEGMDGLGCVDLVGGGGPVAAAPGAVVTVEYTGWWLGPSGDAPTIWETTWSRPRPLRFRVGAGRMIAGIDRGVRGLRKGALRQLHVPALFAFGDWGLPDRLPRDADVVVDLEVLDVAIPPESPAEVSLTDAAGALRYADVVVGDGPAVGEGSTVVVDWVLWDPSGEELDSTWSRAEPPELPVAGLRLGPALIGMRVGGQRQIEVPPGGLGERGEGAELPADQALVARVDLRAVRDGS